MNITLKKEIDDLITEKYVGKKIVTPSKFNGFTVKSAFVKIGIDFDLQLHLSFVENNQHLIIDEDDSIELQE